MEHDLVPDAGFENGLILAGVLDGVIGAFFGLMKTAGAFMRKALAPGMPELPGVMEPEEVDGEAQRRREIGLPIFDVGEVELKSKIVRLSLV